MNEWQQEWQPTERDNRLHELATRYHTECEAYDQTVCTGPMGQDGILPANPHEMALINRNAHAVRKRLTEEAAREGIEREELAQAISKWNGSLPNVEVTGATQLHRGASVLTAGLAGNATTKRERAKNGTQDRPGSGK